MLTESPGFCSHYFRDALKNGKIALEWAVIERSANAPIPSRHCAGEHVPLFVWLAFREKSRGAPCTCSVPATNPSVLGTKKSTMWQKQKEGRKIERKRCSWSTKLFLFCTHFLFVSQCFGGAFQRECSWEEDEGGWMFFRAFFLSAVGCWSQKFTWKVLRQDYPHLQPPCPFIPAPTHTLRIRKYTPSDLNARSVGQRGSTPPSKQDAIFG